MDSEVYAERIADELSALTPVLTLCRRHGVRLPLIVEASPDAPTEALLSALESLCPGGGLLLTHQDDLASATPAFSPEQFRQFLGREFERVVLDLRRGVHADALAASQGWVRGGGIWCLIVPGLERWSVSDDQDLTRLLAWPSRLDEARGLFLQRLKESILTSSFPILQVGDESLCWRRTPRFEGASTPPLEGETQADAIEAIARLMRQRSRRPLIIRADRGRGKSAAMGIGAARILAGRPEARIIVTAPSRQAVTTLMDHFSQQTGSDAPSPGLIFLPPDELMRSWPDADLLLIDEAAALPAPMVLKLVRHYRRVAMATTTCGYEGSGQGFRLRVEPALRKMCPSLNHVELKRPMRWAPGDPLECWLNRLFLQDQLLRPVEVSGDTLLEFRALPATELDADGTLLSQCFTLLREAHYRTTPDDIKILLDASTTRLFGAFNGDTLIGLVWFALEGAFGDADLIDAIVAGKRRPRGHVLPQLLAQISVRKDVLTKLWARVIRIAVHPTCQNMGIGSLLLHKFVQHVRADYPALVGIGAVFAGDPVVLRFWQRQQFRAVYLGTRADAWTACHAVGVLRSFQPVSGLHDAYRLLSNLVRTYGATALSDAPAELLDEILLSLTGPPSPWPEDPPALVSAYASGARPLDLARPDLLDWLMLWVKTGRYSAMDPELRRWTLALALQQHDWTRICRDFDHAHPRSAEQAYRQALRQTLKPPHASDT
ncbi:MAG: tRNA(Met) cytidine acetyltransferase [Gammaproteobacteria bacterium]|nr:MAG: tRNA(Met) cytidine acetyltransferase [Gammaproteobacteria bacterium]